MNRLPRQAEDVTHIPAAKRKNNAAFVDSAFAESILNSGSEEKPESKIHGFSNTLARTKNADGKVLGWNAAIILRYLSNASRKYGKVIDGKRWVRVNLDHISEQYPYMGRSTVDDNVAYLEEFGCCEKMNGLAELKSRKNDRTRCYHIPKNWMDAAEEEPRYFDTAVAKRVKVPAAVIYYNFQHWIGECKVRKLVEQVQLAPATLMGLMPFSKSTIKRSLKMLEEEDYLHPVAGKTCWYADGPDKVWGSKPDDRGSKPDRKGPNPDEKGPEPDNYIYCNRLTDVLETDSKLKPAALVLENVSDGKEANHEQIHLLHEDIAAFADEQDRKEMRHDENALCGSELPIPLVQSVATEAMRYEVMSPGDEITMCSAEEPKHIEVISPPSSNISVEDEHVEGKWPEVADYEFLRSKNQLSSAFASRLEKMPGMKEKLLDTVGLICRKTFAQLDWDTLDELCAIGDPEEVLAALRPFHRAFFDNGTLDPSHSFFDILYFGSLEAMVGAIVWTEKRHDFYSHPISLLSHVTYSIHLVFWRRAENSRLKAIEEEFAERREEYASVDEQKEAEAFLSPAEKMRVFRNALHSLNKVGWVWFDQTHQTHRIKVNKVGLQRIQKMFELNPDLAPADLLPIMEACMKLYAGQPAPGRTFTRGIQWHARMGHRLDIFASYLKTIVKQLGIASPVAVYLNEEEASDEPAREEEMALAA